MRVYIQSYNTCFQNVSGGIHVRIEKIVSELKRANIDVHYYDKFKTILHRGDILHIFRIDLENVDLIRHAKNIGVHTILSSVISADDGWKIDLYRRFINKLPIPTTYKFFFEILNSVDLIVAESATEKRFICKHFNISDKKIIVIANGVDDIKVDDECIYDAIGAKEPYVLQVGRFDKNKNQLSLIKALIKESIHVVFIGGPDYSSKSYYQRCLDIATKNNCFHFLGWVDSNSPLIKSAYSNATVLVVPSFNETFGMVVLEGGVSGANLVISEKLPILDYKELNCCLTINPRSIKDIRTKVLKAFHLKRTDHIRNVILKHFCWESIAKEYIECYKCLK